MRYWCAYYSLRIPEYRRDIPIGYVAEYTREIAHEFRLRNVSVRGYVRSCSCLALSYITNHLKDKSVRKILQRFLQLRIKASGKLWTRSYFVAAVGNVTADIVKQYVEEQWSKGEKHEKDQHSEVASS